MGVLILLLRLSNRVDVVIRSVGNVERNMSMCVCMCAYTCR